METGEMKLSDERLSIDERGRRLIRLDGLTLERNPLPPPTREEQDALRASIARDGIMVPITLRHRDTDEYLIVDGHTRVAIAQELGLTWAPYELIEIACERDVEYILDRQLCRRNLSQSARALIVYITYRLADGTMEMGRNELAKRYAIDRHYLSDFAAIYKEAMTTNVLDADGVQISLWDLFVTNIIERGSAPRRTWAGVKGGLETIGKKRAPANYARLQQSALKTLANAWENVGQIDWTEGDYFERVSSGSETLFTKIPQVLRPVAIRAISAAWSSAELRTLRAEIDNALKNRKN